jgi:hypothetical protein
MAIHAKHEYDTERAPPHELQFHRCERGFIFRQSGDYERQLIVPRVWAFADIESAARWLIEQYALGDGK